MKFSRLLIAGFSVCLSCSTILEPRLDPGHEPPLPSPLSTEEYTYYNNLPRKLELVNQWVMDDRAGFRPENEGKRIIKEGQYFKDTELRAGVRDAAGTKKVIHELTRTLVAITRDQPFENGNHRTAIILLIDYLASVNIVWSQDPLFLYKILDGESQVDDKEVPAFVTKMEEIINWSIGEQLQVPDTVARMGNVGRMSAAVAQRGTTTTAMRERYVRRVKESEKYWNIEHDLKPTVERAMRVYQEHRFYNDRTEEEIARMYKEWKDLEAEMKKEVEHWKLGNW